MTITIKASVLIALAIGGIWFWLMHKYFNSDHDRYGIGAMFCGMFTICGWFFITAVYFAGAYFGWWIV